MKKKRNIFLLLGSISTLALPIFMATKCGNKDKPNENKKQEEPKKPEDSKEENNLADEWGNQISPASFSRDLENEDFFNEVIKNVKDYKFLYEYNNKAIVAFKKDEAINWKVAKQRTLWKLNSERDKIYQLINAKEPLQKGKNKFSSILDLETKEESGNISIKVTFKTGIFNKDKLIISKETFELNIDTVYGEEGLKVEEAAKITTFSYPNISDVFVKDADIEKIVKNIPEGYELSYYKPAINVETNDITIIYKLKSKTTGVTNLRNKFYVIKGWKKTQEMINSEKEAIDKINSLLSNCKVLYLNEKAYQSVHKNHLLNINNSPNFVVNTINGADISEYQYELSDLKVESNKVTVKLTLKYAANTDIASSKKIVVSNEYSKGMNPHTLTEEKQKEYLKQELEKAILYPYYSKDESYIKKEKNKYLTNKSYWIENKNYDLNYSFGSVKKDNNDFSIEVTASFNEWTESPKVSKTMTISFDKLGINILNDIRVKKGLQPLEDQFAPNATLEDEIEYEKIDLIDYKPTPSDEYGSNLIYKNFLDSIAKSKLKLISKKIEELIIKEGPNFLKAQHINVDKETGKNKSEVFIFAYSKHMMDSQNVLIISDPIIENNKVKSIKLSLNSLANTIAKDYTSLVSKRVEIDNSSYSAQELRIEAFRNAYGKSIKVTKKINEPKTNDDFDIKIENEKLQAKILSFTKKTKSFSVKIEVIFNNEKYEYSVSVK
ncbi:hypothetical protein [Metamycoplasma equirhinis]|uniref:hypothetical protein n=1 Tax=Metamycoplasma equirhinis TaxID=92402 RepID=UPI0035946F27